MLSIINISMPIINYIKRLIGSEPIDFEINNILFKFDDIDYKSNIYQNYYNKIIESPQYPLYKKYLNSGSYIYCNLILNILDYATFITFIYTILDIYSKSLYNLSIQYMFQKFAIGAVSHIMYIIINPVASFVILTLW